MKTVAEILSSGVIYSDKLKIDDDGFKGFLTVDRVDMSSLPSALFGFGRYSRGRYVGIFRGRNGRAAEKSEGFCSACTN